MTNSLVLAVRRQPPFLVAPSKPTPLEFKPLSDIDDQDGFRLQIPVIQYYRNVPLMSGKDPVRVLRMALAKALVFYYPFAGRLREGPGRKLVVECTGEGVSFTEADADVSLEELGESLPPPGPPYSEKLLPDIVPVLGSPLLSFQVTRLACGGFVHAVRLNHTMADATGLVQFMNAVAEIARGAPAPTVMPVWARERLQAQTPPQVTNFHSEFSNVLIGAHPLPPTEVVHRSFFFGPKEVEALRQHLPERLRKCSTFEMIAACVWRSRTVSLGLNPEDEVRFLCFVDFRQKMNPPMPDGYYGNSVAYPAALSSVRDLTSKPLSYAMKLIMEAKARVTHEYTLSFVNLLVLRQRPKFPTVGTYHTYSVSNVTRAGFSELDFGWGKPVYGGNATGGLEAFPGLLSFFVRFQNAQGEEGIVVPICLPGPAMERFSMEIKRMIVVPSNNIHGTRSTL